jgi:hypothetical protein
MKVLNKRILVFLGLISLSLSAQNVPITFRVDLSNYSGSSFNTVHLNGTFNSWCGSCNPMSDANGDGIWETTLSLPMGLIEYKFTLDGWAVQEQFSGGESCTKTTSSFTNREFQVTGQAILDPVCFNSCSSCTLAPSANESTCNCNQRLYFAGRNWTIKEYENITWGPGGNYFSAHEDDVFVDEKGFLHMRLAQRNGKWYSTEVISPDTMGYGIYTFVIEGDLESLPANSVVGLFTWDDNNLATQANSEVDIEIARWGDPSVSDVLLYSVQPVWFGGYYPERTNVVNHAPGDLNGITAHRMIWTDTLITWESWERRADGNNQIGYWTFDLNNPPRVKVEGSVTSDPIVIPAPGNTTHARINFWMFNGGPTSDNQEHEIIIRNFSYEPF